MKKVLIITYYWPPSGGAGVQRWLKFAKYLPDFGWEPIIYTPENPDFAIEDQSLLSDVLPGTKVLKTKIWEPYEIYKFLTGKKGEKVNVSFAGKSKKDNLMHKIALTLRGNLLIPDPKCFWIKPSVKNLIKYHKEQPFDAIISTGPPHSMHLIARGLHRATKLPWIADFRDPWTNIDFYQELNLSWISDKIHRSLEQKVISEADCIVSVTPTWCAELAEKKPKRIELVHNGYDEADVIEGNLNLNKEFSLVHIGSINAARNPKVIWKALNELLKQNKELSKCLKIKLVGSVEEIVLSDINEYNLNDYLELTGYLSHKDAIGFQQQAQVLMLLINNTPNSNGILTGKFYEYMASKRPTLAIGPTKSDIAKLLEETGAGKIVDFEDVATAKSVILEFFELYQKGKLESLAKDYQKYSRRSQCKIMASVLNDIAAK